MLLGKACASLFVNESASSLPTVGGLVYKTKSECSENILTKVKVALEAL